MKPVKPQIVGEKEFWEVIVWLFMTGVFLLRLLYWYLFERSRDR